MQGSGKDEFEALVEAHSAMIWRICGLYEADPDLRRDLQQEVLLAAWRSLKRFRGDSTLRTYLARIAHNRGVSHVASEVRRPRQVAVETALPSGDASPEEVAEMSLSHRRLNAALRRLPMDQRQPVSLTLEGFAPREIADVLGVSANAVSIRLTRAKATLKEILSDADRQ